MDTVDEVLAHFGVRGMKWGVRKAADAPPGPASQVKITTKNGKIISVTGGKNLKPSEDAIAAAAALQRAKASSTAALSNHELGDLNKRLQMEQQYVKLVPTGKIKKGQHFTKEILGVGATLNEVMAFAKSDMGKGIQDVLSAGKGKHIKKRLVV